MSVPESDPLADFLARERDEFGVLEDDDNLGLNSVQQSTAVVNGFVAQSGDNNLLDDSELLDNDATAESDFMRATAPTIASIGALRSADSTPLSSAAMQRIEPEKIRKWREEQKSRLEKKDAQEEIEKEKWRASAKKELEDWYKNRAEQLEKTEKNNKIAEQEFLKERDAETPGQEWERISRLCDFNPKANKNAKDVTRMRSILVQMKTQPVKQE